MFLNFSKLEKCGSRETKFLRNRESSVEMCFQQIGVLFRFPGDLVLNIFANSKYNFNLNY